MFTSLFRSSKLEIRNTTAEDSISIKSSNNIEWMWLGESLNKSNDIK